MKTLSLFVLSLTLISSLFAQETIVWGSEIIDVSSEYSPYEYSAIQALRRPNVLPGGGDNPNAWRPKKTDKEEFIVISFSNPIVAKQVAIAESENPGSVKEVYAYDSDYNEFKLFELTPRNLPIESRLLNLFFEETTYKIQAIKIVMDGSVNPGYNAIDAVGISSSNIPINVLINLTPGVAGDVEAEKLSENVNSSFPEHSPIISPDGKRMYFSRQYHPENIGGEDDSEDIWVSEWDEEKQEWSIAKNVGAPLNNKGPNFISSINEVNGEEIFILGNRYGKKGRMYTGVSMSKKLGDAYTEPIDIEIEDEYNYSPNADYFLVSGGEVILLSAERDDTYGKRDIYVSFLKSDSTWTIPKNLGEVLNSTGEDESPFLADDKKTLYFASDGYSGYGGSDIFVSIRQDDSWTNWTEPQNMGESVNKAGDDEYFNIPSSGQRLYFTRGEKGEDTDIYTFNVEDLFIDKNSPLIASVDHLLEKKGPFMVLISGRVLDSKTNKPAKNTKVTLEQLPEGVEVESKLTDPETGQFSFTAPSGLKYAITANADGYIAEDESIDLLNTTSPDTIKKDISMVLIKKDEVIVLNNVFFDFDRATLKTDSYPVLKRVVQYIEEDQIDAIEIMGHTDSTGPENYNLELSRKRAQSVMDYLLENGVNKEQLSVKAFGETQPKTTNETKEGRAENRRVEFKIE